MGFISTNGTHIPNVDPFPPFDDSIGLLYAKTEKEESLGGALKYIQR